MNQKNNCRFLSILAGVAHQVVLALLVTSLAIPIVAQALEQQEETPGFLKVFSPDSIGPGSTSTLQFTIDNSSGAEPVTDLTFVDVMPANVTLADPALASTNCQESVGASLIAPDGGAQLSFSNFSVAAGATCEVLVNVTSSTPGTHTNTSGDLTSSAGNSGTAEADLTVDVGLPGFSKSFSPSTVPIGDRSTLTFTIDNSLNPSAVATIDFTDQLPIGMQIAAPANASTTCGSEVIPTTVIAPDGGNQLIVDGNGNSTTGFPALGAGSTCQVTLDVQATGSGNLDNISSDLMSIVGFFPKNSGKAAARLTVSRTDLTIEKQFVDDPVAPGGNTTVEFKITNFDRGETATNISFDDNLSHTLAGLSYDSLLFNDCQGSVGGIETTDINFAGGQLPPEGSCTIRASLAVPAMAMPGIYPNTTTAVTATVGGEAITGNQASDKLFVDPAPILTKEFLEDGTLTPDPIAKAGDDVVIRYTITNVSATSGATDITFLDELTDAIGNGLPGIGFLPFPVTATLPPMPNPPCGAGSSLALIIIDQDRQSFELTGGTLAAAGMAGDSCTFDVTITLPTDLGPGEKPDPADAPSATVDGATRTGQPASASLTVIAAPTLRKLFTDDPVAPGGTATLEFELSYSEEATVAATDISFTDDLTTVAGVTVSTMVQPDPPCGPGSSLTASMADTLLTFAGGTLEPGETCTFSVTLQVPAAATPQPYTNTTSVVSATVDGTNITSPPASDDLNVAGITLNKEFLDSPVIAGETTTLRFTIDNIHPTLDAEIGFFTDSLSTALSGLAATGGPLINTCGGELSGTTFLIYVGGNVSSGMNCTIEVEVLVPSMAADGIYTNITSNLSANQGGEVPVPPAIADLVVASELISLQKAFSEEQAAAGGIAGIQFSLENLNTNLTAGDALNISFTDDLNAALSGLTFTEITSNTCGGMVSGTHSTTVTVSDITLASGASCLIEIEVAIPEMAMEGLFTNTTSEVSATIDGLAVNGSASSDSLTIFQTLNFSKSFASPSVAGGTTTLDFTIENPSSTSAAANMSFLDDLDAVLPGLIATSLPIEPCGSGSSVTGSSTLIFTGGELDPMASCEFSVDVLLPGHVVPGSYPNTTSDLVIAGLKVADPATSDLQVEPAPTFAKAFAANPIDFVTDDVSTLTFTIDNSASALSATELDFTDSLPAGLIVATPANALNTCTGGTLTTAPGAGVITYTGGSVAAGAMCTISVDVSPETAGMFVNLTGDLTSSSGNSGTATDVLTVLTIELQKTFLDEQAVAGGTVRIQFRLENLNTNLTAGDALNISFTDDLAAALSDFTFTEINSNSCGGMVSGTHSTTVTISGIALASSASCLIEIEAAIPEIAMGGVITNTTSEVTTTIDGFAVTGSPASDTLNIFPLLDFSKNFESRTTANGTTTLVFTIENPSNSAAANLSFLDDLDAVIPGLIATDLPDQPCGPESSISGTSTLIFTGGELAPMSSCIFSVELLAPVHVSAGSYPNTTSDLMRAGLTVADPATSDLFIEPTPTFNKLFGDNPIDLAVTPTTTLTFTIDNSASAVDATELDFTDSLPAGLIVATPANSVTTCTGGTLTADPGASTISYSGGSVAAGSTCTISVDVSPETAGMFVNVSGDLTSSSGNSGTSTDTLTVTTSDADNDGILDGDDNCPNDPNPAQEDLDSDGQGDACEDDTDGDGLPDDYETANGLDPNNSLDQQADPDGDGFTNLEEFEFRTDPNTPNLDENNNGKPDVVDDRAVIVPAVILPLILEPKVDP